MFEIVKRWWFYWNRSRESKKFFKKQIRMYKYMQPAEYNEKTRLAVIEDWKKAGYDITVPNFSGKRIERSEMEFNYGNR